jgi:Family of unknown function (DUF6476)
MTAPTPSPTESPALPQADPPIGALLSDAQINLVRRAVIVMTALLIAGVALLIGRVVYLAQRGSGQPSAAAMASTPQAALLPEVRLALPAGAEIKQVSLSGSRLAVTHSQPGANDGVIVLDLATGAVVSRVVLERTK